MTLRSLINQLIDLIPVTGEHAPVLNADLIRVVNVNGSAQVIDGDKIRELKRSAAPQDDPSPHLL